MDAPSSKTPDNARGGGMARPAPALRKERAPENVAASVNVGFTSLDQRAWFQPGDPDMDEWNHALFLLLNAGPEPSAPVAFLAIVAAKLLIAAAPLHIALVWFGGTRAMRFVALTGVLALAVALGLNLLIGLVAYTPRPFVIGLGHALIDHRPSASFPSNHATVLFVWAATLALCGLRRLALAFAGLGALVAWSRVYLGVHFPLDMAGAALVSGASAVLALQIMLRQGPAWLSALERLATRFAPASKA